MELICKFSIYIFLNSGSPLFWNVYVQGISSKGQKIIHYEAENRISYKMLKGGQQLIILLGY